MCTPEELRAKVYRQYLKKGYTRRRAALIAKAVVRKVFGSEG